MPWWNQQNKFSIILSVDKPAHNGLVLYLRIFKWVFNNFFRTVYIYSVFQFICGIKRFNIIAFSWLQKHITSRVITRDGTYISYLKKYLDYVNRNEYTAELCCFPAAKVKTLLLAKMKSGKQCDMNYENSSAVLWSKSAKGRTLTCKWHYVWFTCPNFSSPPPTWQVASHPSRGSSCTCSKTGHSVFVAPPPFLPLFEIDNTTRKRHLRFRTQNFNNFPHVVSKLRNSLATLMKVFLVHKKQYTNSHL